ncbi:TetR family transcriptional regulator [Paenibacillus sp. J31TS4]|uniref:TetR/AcrR family transcriptional regulator n=1 Tax=Paenibacillus sp. J31TS4 TaxID=2807195 RepID=UPI001B1F40A5|nr:TetR/AcrR family transcriptional regulator [Paenibacillus sp. J31TS4]GIP37841.1 TetR family transcriptional regulator [Paenibacillus sp. J31TS4]
MGTKGQQKREFILDRAKEVFVQKGYAATSMEDLVHHSGVSKGSIYYHFDSKETLFIKLMERYLEEWEAGWTEKEACCSTVEEKLFAIAEHYALDSQTPLQKVAEDFYISQPRRSEAIKMHLLELVHKSREPFERIFREAELSGELSVGKAGQMTVIFSGLLDGLSQPYSEDKLEDMLVLYKEAVRCFLYGINGEPGKK